MRYVSLFSGIGGFELGVERVFSQATCAGFSEVDPYAIKMYTHRFPNHPALGDVSLVKGSDLGAVDLLVAGFPCTDLSIGNVQNLGLEGLRSGLIREALRLMRECQPSWFIIENVASMKAHNVQAISELLGVEPVLLNSADVSGQNRERLFWANFPIAPLVKGNAPSLADVLESNPDPKLLLSERELEYMKRTVKGGRCHWDFGHHHDTAKGKSACLPANLHKGVPYNVLIDRRGAVPVYRKLSPLEAERLQTFPDGHTEFGADGKRMSNSRRWKALGNAVTVDVIAHIAKCLETHIASGAVPERTYMAK